MSQISQSNGQTSESVEGAEKEIRSGAVFLMPVLSFSRGKKERGSDGGGSTRFVLKYLWRSVANGQAASVWPADLNWYPG